MTDQVMPEEDMQMHRTAASDVVGAAGVERVRSMMDTINVPAGTILAREDTPGFDVFIVVEGTATVTVHGEHIGYAAPGDVVGATGLPGLGTSRATVTAETTMRLLTSETKSFLKALGLPEAARSTAKAIARRLQTEGRRNDGAA